MIIAVNPILISILAIFLFKEHCNFRQGLGMLLSVCDALIIISKGQITTMFQGNGGGMGELYMVGCVISWSAYTFIGKKLLKNIEPLITVT